MRLERIMEELKERLIEVLVEELLKELMVGAFFLSAPDDRGSSMLGVLIICIALLGYPV